MKNLYLSTFVTLLAITLVGCSNYVNVDTFKYMEISAEKEGQLIIRAIYISSSDHIITRYKMTQKKATKGNNYFLSLIQELYKKRCPEVEYMLDKWPGIRITIPVKSFNPETDNVFYKDSNGIHRITIGTKESWKKYLKEKFKISVDDSAI